jgi:hypothetical protein
MNTTKQPLQVITHQAIQILCREIGVVNTVRFIRQFSTGLGNYTDERAVQHEGKSLETLVSEIKAMRKKS